MDNNFLEAIEAIDILDMSWQIINQMPNPILITDENGIIVWVNTAFMENCGYKEVDILGKNPSIFKSGKHTDEFYKNLWSTILSCETWNGTICNKYKYGNKEEFTIKKWKNKKLC